MPIQARRHVGSAWRALTLDGWPSLSREAVWQGRRDEKSLLETIQNQSTQINALTAQVTDLSGEVLGLESDLSTVTGGLASLEGTVDETCDQLEVLTDQSNDILNSLLGSSVAVLGNLLNVPSPPDELGTFECT